MNKNRRIVILAEGNFSPLESKTANQAIRYIPEKIVAVIDSRHAGSLVQDVLTFGGDIPVYSNLESTLVEQPDTLLVGIAPPGGRLPESWRTIINDAIDHKLDIISGLHSFLSDDQEFSQRAKYSNVKLIDLRKVGNEYEVIAQGLWKHRRARTVLTVGTDCNVGKMTVALELHREFSRRGLNSDFVATGQTGIFISGKGVAVDSLISDYVAGAIELEIEKSVEAGHDYIFVEGQGALTHQGYSSVTLGLLHGVMPDAMIMVHHPARHIDDYGFPIDDVNRLMELHEKVIAPFKLVKVVGIAVNSAMMTREEVETAKMELERSSKLPVADVLTPEVAILADALEHYFRTKITVG